ncbi:MAG: amidophosphoribosyltransferase, partial [Planctomycetota bacterium]
YPNVYGIDMPSAPELIAHEKTDEQIAVEIGADWLVYQDLDDLIACAKEGNPSIDDFECSVFDGRYVTGDVDAAYLEGLQATRSDAAKQAAAESLKNVSVATG